MFPFILVAAVLGELSLAWLLDQPACDAPAETGGWRTPRPGPLSFRRGVVRKFTQRTVKKECGLPPRHYVSAAKTLHSAPEGARSLFAFRLSFLRAVRSVVGKNCIPINSAFHSSAPLRLRGKTVFRTEGAPLYFA